MPILDASLLEREERRTGRHTRLLSQCETVAARCFRLGYHQDAELIRSLMEAVVHQEIELRQAIAEKRSRPVPFRK